MKGVRVAIQGVGSVGGGVARLLAKDGAKLVLADVNAERAKALAAELGAEAVDACRDPRHRDRRVQPQCAGRDPHRAVDRRAEDDGRGRRREQPARDARGRRSACTTAASSTPPIT
jgi:3-hydroxyacyl-CoA dehydrogenase